MKTQIENILLKNKKGKTLRVYKVENENTCCIRIEGGDHFEFEVQDIERLIQAINVVVYSIS